MSKNNRDRSKTTPASAPPAPDATAAAQTSAPVVATAENTPSAEAVPGGAKADEGLSSPESAVIATAPADLKLELDALTPPISEAPPASETPDVIVPPAPTPPKAPAMADLLESSPTIELKIKADEELDMDLEAGSPGGFIISADQVRGFLAAVAAGKAHVLPEVVAELADAIAQGRAPDVTPELFTELKMLLPQPPALEPKDFPKLVKVTFTRQWPPYNNADVAGFELAEAEKLVKLGIASFTE